MSLYVYGNGFCFVQGKTRDFILLSHDIGLINDDVLLLLYPSYISHDLRELVIPATKQTNTVKKFDCSRGRVFVQRDKPGNTELLILIKYILNRIKQL